VTGFEKGCAPVHVALRRVILPNGCRAAPATLARTASNRWRDNAMYCHIQLLYRMGNPRRRLIWTFESQRYTSRASIRLRAASSTLVGTPRNERSLCLRQRCMLFNVK